MIIIIGLSIIAVLAYLSIMRILDMQWNPKRTRLYTLLQEDQVQEKNKIVRWLERKGIIQYISPTYIRESSQKYGAEITKASYYSTFLVGTVIGVIIMVIYFQPFLFLMPVSIIGGIIATNVRLHNIKKEYIQLMDSKLSIYMLSISTAMNTFSSVREALTSVLPSIEEPLRKDLEEALLHLQDGKDIRFAFQNMNHNHPRKELRLFHDQLDVIVKGGTSDDDTLRNIANKMKKKETYRRRLKTVHKQQLKAWRAFVFLSLSAPFLFIIISMDNFVMVMNQESTSIIFALTFILIFTIYRKLEQLELYDPTIDESIDYS